MKSPLNSSSQRLKAGCWRSLARGPLLVALATLALGAARCPGAAPSSQGANAATAPRDSADQLLFGARMVLQNHGITRGELRADSAWKYDEGILFVLRGVTVALQNSMGVKDGVLTARRARYSLPNGRVQFDGDVQVVGTDGRRLKVAQLVFELDRNQFTSDSTYVFTLGNSGRPQTGAGLSADPQLRKVTSKSAATPNATTGNAAPGTRR